MKKLILYFVYFFSLLLFTVFATSLQTTLWYQLFGSIPGPLLWLLIICYINIYKKPTEGILLNYFLVIQIYFFGWLPIGFLWFLILILFGITMFIKKRIFWGGPRYFLYASTLSVVGYQILYLLCSYFFESISVRELDLFERIFQIILTPLFSVPVYNFMKLLERWTDQVPLLETGEYTYEQSIY